MLRAAVRAGEAYWCRRKVVMEMATESKRRGHRLDWFVVVILCVLGYFSYTMIDQQIHLNELDHDCAAAQQRLETAQRENAELKDLKAKLDDPAYIEKTAREERGMTHEGELPYIAKK